MARVAGDSPASWRGKIMDNRQCARRPSFRALLEEEGALFAAPLPRRSRAFGSTKKKGVGGADEPLFAIRGMEGGFPARRRLSAAPQGPTGISDSPRRLMVASFRTARPVKDDFISAASTHPGAGPADSWKWRNK